MIVKYIIIEESNSPMIFVKQVEHSDVAKSFGTIKYAGFCKIGIKKKDFKIK